MKSRRFFPGCVCLFAAAAVLFMPQRLSAAINVNGSLEAKNQSGIHEGDVYRNYLKATLSLVRILIIL